MVRPQVFVHKDTQKPLRFHLDHKINSDIRDKWAAKIQEYGGRVAKYDADADYVIITRFDDRIKRQIAYAGSREQKKRAIVVQTLLYLQECISQKKLVVPREIVKGMGGTSGQGRQAYTQEDDENLARYFAAVLPDLASGGRQGDKIYQTAISLAATHPEYRWALRHSWQSWKEHYKKNQEKINQITERYVRQVNPERRHRWFQDRRNNKHGRIKRQEEPVESEEEDSEEDSEEDEDEAPGKIRSPAPGSEDARSDQGREEHEQPRDNNSPPPPEGRNPDADWDEWPNGQGAQGSQEPFDEEAPEPQPVQPIPERHARFVTTSSPEQQELENSEGHIAHSRRRKYSFESTPNKRPRFQSESSDPWKRPVIMKRGARRPPNFRPTVDLDSDEEESETSEVEADSSEPNVPHESEEQEETMLLDEQAPAVQSVASTSTLPLSRDKTLVASRPLSHKGKGVAAVLSSASGGKVYLEEELLLDEHGGEDVQEVIVITDEDEDAEPRNIPMEILQQDSDQSDDHIQAPVANTARTRRRRAEQSQRTERSAPYRMTRSRSRSVETEFVSLPAKRTKGKAKAKVVEPDIIEEEPSVEIVSSKGEFDLAEPQQETLAEEEDVMKMVTNEDDYSGISNATSVANQSSTTLSRRESPSSNSDDDQIMRQVAAQHQAAANIIKKGPRQSDLLLRNFQAQLGRRNPRPSLPASLALERATRKLTASALEHRTSSAAPTSQLKVPPGDTWKAPQTPTPVKMGAPSRMRALSEASSSNDTAESIPAAGTRAEAYKRRIEEEEKHTLYTPPRGTRASMHLLEQESRSQLWR